MPGHAMEETVALQDSADHNSADHRPDELGARLTAALLDARIGLRASGTGAEAVRRAFARAKAEAMVSDPKPR
ncbi:MAG: hypothetical protein DI556_17790 [Rhodovulum sulfidophilum]|uniref:Uncharacterized protein n=1 Tax=Rhodovulum sulfidophilum TaxID=35806 RepID=A0A2W5N1D3_RHOSU|nr:MAG: hypothetical protein DI556_17790 [Rhodovulum sulfidophilum]